MIEVHSHWSPKIEVAIQTLMALAIIIICGVSYKIHFVSYLLCCEKTYQVRLSYLVRYRIVCVMVSENR